jgi:lipopolysaccharide export LptBFGC system permease protein LptF
LLRTLHGYLAGELLRVAALAVVAFTLVMTVFAVIEPLRTEGLGASQLLALVGYTLPMMLSLTLPVAALFAATIVYGRFSQDNELMACRASGISTVLLLKPALLLVLGVTAASLWLGYFVTPRLAASCERVIHDNLAGILSHRLRTQGYVDWERNVLHAAEVRADGNRLILRGVVASSEEDPDNIVVAAAPRAVVRFLPRGGEVAARVTLQDPDGMATGRPFAGSHRGRRFELPREIPLPSPLRQEPSFYSLPRLLQTLRRPLGAEVIQQQLEKRKQEIAGEIMARQVVEAIRAGRRYAGLRGERKACVLTAGDANVAGGAAKLRAAADANGRIRRVRAVVHEPAAVQTVLADEAEVRARWWAVYERFVVSVKLRGNVRTRVTGTGAEPNAAPAGGWVSRQAVEIGGLRLPEGVAEVLDELEPERLLYQPRRYTADPRILTDLAYLRDHDLKRLVGKVLGELHGRTAYGLSCFLLVSLGAALGVLFRGGQILSAFALSVIPGGVTIVLVLMGQEMVSNPDVSRAAGLGAIWAGVVALLAGNAYIYAAPLRR